jgi:hypothetical protein
MAAECVAGGDGALGSMNLAESHLMDIGRWIIERKN